MIEMSVFEEQKVRAREYAVLTEPFHHAWFGKEKKERIAKIAWGKLGEEIFSQYLKDNGIQNNVDYVVHPGKTLGPASDFYINGQSIDVKAGSKEYHTRLLVIQEYFDTGNKSDLYVGINFYNAASVARIFGYATTDQVAKAPVQTWHKTNPVPDYTIPYKDLMPMHNLLSVLQ